MIGSLKTAERLYTYEGKNRKYYEDKGERPDYKGHHDHVLCLAASSDGKFLASGGRDNLINIWDISEKSHLKTFRSHRKAVSALCFRKGFNHLYSGSFDRSVKIWNIDEMGYVETL